MKATVPKSALPTALAADNRLTTIYTTHVLFPKLGPLASQRYTRVYARLLRDYAAAVELVRLARQYQETYKKPVAIPAPPPPANTRDFRFEPILRGGNLYRTKYLAGLLEFGTARIAEPTGMLSTLSRPGAGWKGCSGQESWACVSSRTPAPCPVGRRARAL